MPKTLGSIPSTTKKKVFINHICKLNTQKAEAESSKIQGKLGLYSEIVSKRRKGGRRKGRKEARP
jgi:hypothetical protein